MKKILLFVLFAAFCDTFAQSQPAIDQKLIGSWQGHEKDKQLEGVEKHWVQHRFEDGTYLILFTVIYHDDGRVESFAEQGKWWIADEKFYELHSGGENPEVYSYTVIDDEHVKFKLSDSGDLRYDQPDYEFIDVKIEEDSM